LLSTPRHAMPATPRTPSKRQRSDFSEELPSTWEGTCEWVLTQRMSLWDMLLEPILLQVGCSERSRNHQRGAPRRFLAPQTLLVCVDLAGRMSGGLT